MWEETNREVPRGYVCNVYLRNSMELYAAGKLGLDFSRDICPALEGFTTFRVLTSLGIFKALVDFLL